MFSAGRTACETVASLPVARMRLSGPLLSHPHWSRDLFLDNNALNGTFPSAMLSMTALQQLAMDSNQFSGAIPDAISLLSNLETLTLSDNLFNSTLPSTIGQLSQLRHVSRERMA